jgi:F-type H+-transporting ATPase subunit b
MLIDWFTVVAQALNFLILVWLMKRFLYKPVLDAIDVRERRIASDLAEAATKTSEAARERADFEQKNADFDQQRSGLLNKAVEEANAKRRHLLEEARRTADDFAKKRQQAMRNEAAALNQTIARRTQEEVFAISRKALSDLADCPLEERIAEVFARRLSGMDGNAKALFEQALKASAEPAEILSAFDLPTAQREAIQRVINEIFSADVRLRFETAPDLIGGIELTANGQKIGWSISEYLRSLEKSVGELLAPKDLPAEKRS